MTFTLYTQFLWPLQSQTWRLDRGARFTLPLQISFCLQMGQRGAGAVLPECKHSMGCLLLGYHYFFLSTILQSTLLVPLALPFITLLTLQHKPGMYRNATSNADWLHHWLCMTSPPAPSVTPDSLYGLPAEMGADRLWLL